MPTLDDNQCYGVSSKGKSSVAIVLFAFAKSYEAFL